jgi:hypothetical protein
MTPVDGSSNWKATLRTVKVLFAVGTTQKVAGAWRSDG